jgi:hypothetical protein
VGIINAMTLQKCEFLCRMCKNLMDVHCGVFLIHSDSICQFFYLLMTCLGMFLPQFIDLRLAVLGNVDAGKSTILGVLTHGELDNGRGRARLNLFRHLHEIQSGRTSSIGHEILGFNSQGEVIQAFDCQHD